MPIKRKLELTPNQFINQQSRVCHYKMPSQIHTLLDNVGEKGFNTFALSRYKSYFGDQFSSKDLAYLS